MADSAEPFARAVALALGRVLAIEVQFVADVAWPQREQALYAGDIHVAWLCGLPYVRDADRDDPRIELLAAPVMLAARYGAAAVYFSDVVVRHDHPARSFDDLRGATLAINEPNSHSGYQVLRHALAQRAAAPAFFPRVVESGAHQRSLELIDAGVVDTAAIDSTVLETQLRLEPGLASRLRTVATFGPSPMPPWVASRQLPQALRARLRSALLEIGRDPQAGEARASAQVRGFAPVDEACYSPIRAMARSAAGYALNIDQVL